MILINCEESRMSVVKKKTFCVELTNTPVQCSYIMSTKFLQEASTYMQVAQFKLK